MRKSVSCDKKIYIVLFVTLIFYGCAKAAIEPFRMYKKGEVQTEDLSLFLCGGGLFISSIDNKSLPYKTDGPIEIPSGKHIVTAYVHIDWIGKYGAYHKEISAGTQSIEVDAKPNRIYRIRHVIGLKISEKKYEWHLTVKDVTNYIMATEIATSQFVPESYDSYRRFMVEWATIHKVPPYGPPRSLNE